VIRGELSLVLGETYRPRVADMWRGTLIEGELSLVLGETYRPHVAGMWRGTPIDGELSIHSPVLWGVYCLSSIP